MTHESLARAWTSSVRLCKAWGIAWPASRLQWSSRAMQVPTRNTFLRSGSLCST